MADLEKIKTVPELEKEYEELALQLYKVRERLKSIGVLMEKPIRNLKRNKALSLLKEIGEFAECWVNEISINKELGKNELLKKIVYIEQAIKGE